MVEKWEKLESIRKKRRHSDSDYHEGRLDIDVMEAPPSFNSFHPSSNSFLRPWRDLDLRNWRRRRVTHESTAFIPAADRNRFFFHAPCSDSIRVAQKARSVTLEEKSRLKIFLSRFIFITSLVTLLSYTISFGDDAHSYPSQQLFALEDCEKLFSSLTSTRIG
jgi:hypothetical protein